jgi:hypothetical protein
MFWPVYIYIVISIVIAVSAWSNSGFAVGLSAIGTSALSLIAGGGLKAALWWGDKSQKIAGIIIAAVVMALAYWISHRFSAQLFSYSVTGELWGFIGFVTCFVFTNKKLAS